MDEQLTTITPRSTLNPYPIALAVFLGLVMVAGAIFFSGKGTAATSQIVGATAVAADTSPMRAENRIVYGSADAETTIVEFSDFECPFCARVHPTLKRIVDESDGSINWEYRHLPLPIHANAQLAAIVGECISRTLGTDAFWQYSDIILAQQRQFSNDYFVNVITELGADQSAMESCIADPEIAKQVSTDMATAQSLGGSGTPFNVIVYPDGNTKPVSGALPYEQWLPFLN